MFFPADATAISSGASVAARGEGTFHCDGPPGSENGDDCDDCFISPLGSGLHQPPATCITVDPPVQEAVHSRAIFDAPQGVLSTQPLQHQVSHQHLPSQTDVLLDYLTSEPIYGKQASAPISEAPSEADVSLEADPTTDVVPLTSTAPEQTPEYVASPLQSGKLACDVTHEPDPTEPGCGNVPISDAPAEACLQSGKVDFDAADPTAAVADPQADSRPIVVGIAKRWAQPQQLHIDHARLQHLLLEQGIIEADWLVNTSPSLHDQWREYQDEINLIQHRLKLKQ